MDSVVLAIWVVGHRRLEKEGGHKKGGMAWQKEFLACCRAQNKISLEALLYSVSGLDQTSAY